MKKGFTLIELLAVIVILAIIAVIATPIVLNIINDTKENANLRSGDFYLKAVDYSISDRALHNKTIKDGTYQILENGNICLLFTNSTCSDELVVEVNGEKPSSGTITIEGLKVVNSQLGLSDTYVFKNEKGNIVNAKLANTILNSYNGQNKIIENTVFTDSSIVENGLYKAIDDYGMSYYFFGAVINNYVQFGTYEKDTTFEVCRDDECETIETVTIPKGSKMYWRIVRINGDGSIRLIYDGIDKYTNGTKHDANIGKTIYTEDSYSGVFYGGNKIEEYINSWYENNLKTKYEEYLADPGFCNDTSVMFCRDSEGNLEDCGSPYSIVYGASGRLSDSQWYNPDLNITPQLTCEKSDLYTINTSNGNGRLKNPIATITADEIALAVSLDGNLNHYLYTGEKYWTISPGDFLDTDGISIYQSYGDGNLEAGLMGYSITEWAWLTRGISNVRPVINLKADVEFTGTGKIGDPYIIKTN